MKKYVKSSRTYRIISELVADETDKAIQVCCGQDGRFPIRYKIWLPKSQIGYEDHNSYIVIHVPNWLAEKYSLGDLDDIISN